MHSIGRTPSQLPEQPQARRRSYQVLIIALSLLGSIACEQSVVGDLDESEANEALVLLQESSLTAIKSVEVRGGHKSFSIHVPTGEVGTAAALLNQQGIPRKKVETTSETEPLLPSRRREEAQLLKARESALEETISQIQGVERVRIHLEQGSKNAKNGGEPASASLLLSYRGTSSPISESALKKLISGSLSDLSEERVNTVLIQQPSSATNLPNWSRLGFWRMTAESARSIRIVLALSGAGIALACLALFYCLNKIKKLNLKLALLSKLPPSDELEAEHYPTFEANSEKIEFTSNQSA